MRLFSLCAALLVVLTMLACDSDEQGGVGTESPTSELTRSPSPLSDSPTPVDASLSPASETYRNEKYRWEVTVPPGWRAATAYMEAFAEETSYPGHEADPEDYVVLTTLSEEEEIAAVEMAKTTPAIGLREWFVFEQGHFIHLFPMQVLFPGVSREQFLTDVDSAGVIRVNEGEAQVSLESGERALRLTRREADDNGDFTYDVVLVSLDSGDDLAIRIVSTAGFDKDAFEAIFRSFQDVPG